MMSCMLKFKWAFKAKKMHLLVFIKGAFTRHASKRWIECSSSSSCSEGKQKRKSPDCQPCLKPEYLFQSVRPILAYCWHQNQFLQSFLQRTMCFHQFWHDLCSDSVHEVAGFWCLILTLCAVSLGCLSPWLTFFVRLSQLCPKLGWSSTLATI